MALIDKKPDKIYFDGTSSACKQPLFSSQNIEYIRKDALLKKVRKIAIWNTIKVGRKEIRDIVTEIINSL